MALWAQGFQTTKRNKRVKHLLGPCRFTRQFFLQLTSPTSWPHNSRLPDEKKINSDGTVLSSLNSSWKIFLNLVWIFFWRRGRRTFFGTFHCRKPKGFVWWVLILALFHHHLKSGELSWVCVIFHGQFNRAQFCPFYNHPSPCIHDWVTIIKKIK